jgi:hypothetical protein
MIRYSCDWCQQDFPLDEITKVQLENDYNRPVVLHICRDCGRSRMPERVQPMLSWTSP